MKINLHHLRLFHAVATADSLTAAAQALNLSQSALSTQLRQLEDRLGSALFERRGRKLHLTEAGRIALDHAETIFRTAEDLTATLTQSTRRQQPLRVGALATLSRNFQIQFLRPLLGDPERQVQLRSGSQDELLEALEALELDVVLTNQPPPPAGAQPWLVETLAEQAISLIGKEPVESERPLDLKLILTDQPLIVPSERSVLRSGLDALLVKLGVRPRIVAEADDMAMLRLLAREDAGLAVLPPIVVQDELAQGLLHEVAQLPNLRESFYAVTRTRRFPHPLLKDVLNR
mgnify:CR=1 FL=1